MNEHRMWTLNANYSLACKGHANAKITFEFQGIAQPCDAKKPRPVNATHQVILPAFGRVLGIPLFLWGAPLRIHVGRVAIAAVVVVVAAGVIAPVPSSASHSGELKWEESRLDRHPL